MKKRNGNGQTNGNEKTFFTGDKTMTQTQKKTGLTLSLDQYGKLQKRTSQAIITGDIKRAEYLKGIMNRHAPEPILNLRTARI